MDEEVKTVTVYMDSLNEHPQCAHGDYLSLLSSIICSCYCLSICNACMSVHAFDCKVVVVWFVKIEPSRTSKVCTESQINLFVIFFTCILL